MFSNEISFMKTLKIPISHASADNCSPCADVNVQQFEEPDLIKDYHKTSHPCKESDKPCTNNSFLNKMDQEILQAKTNLDKLHRKRLVDIFDIIYE